MAEGFVECSLLRLRDDREAAVSLHDDGENILHFCENPLHWRYARCTVSYSFGSVKLGSAGSPTE
jgi:hypothetical protein